jgi:hypothetical protein
MGSRDKCCCPVAIPNGQLIVAAEAGVGRRGGRDIGWRQDQIEVHVHVRPGNTRHAVEPEARHGRQIALDRDDEVVLICYIGVVVSQEELDERLHLRAGSGKRLVGS